MAKRRRRTKRVQIEVCWTKKEANVVFRILIAAVLGACPVPAQQLVFEVASICSLALVLVLPAASVCQGQMDRPAEFEVVSVKRQPPAPYGFLPGLGPLRFKSTGERFTDHTVSVQEIILQAFDVADHQVLGLPDWANPRGTPGGEYYDIDATAPFDDPTTSELRIMLQSVLAKRFNLRCHWEERELAVYALVVVRSGSKLPQAPADSRGLTMYSLIQMMSPLVADHPIVDHTGLKGQYVAPRPGDVSHARGDPLGAASEVSAMLEDRYGLKLEPRKELTRMLVVDHIERPSPN
jgi:hypothetical protein